MVKGVSCVVTDGAVWCDEHSTVLQMSHYNLACLKLK